MTPDNDSMDPVVQEEYYYEIRLLISHPTMRASEITAALGMQPDYSWNAGEGNHIHTMWGHVFRTSGNREFFQEVNDVLDWFAQRRNAVGPLLSSGGQVQVVVQLPGAINIGDTLRPEALKLASELGVCVGVEVFPRLPRHAH